ncbi:hypothetical protein CQW23_19410 [Capsicum baccatum]|uniref:Beta-amylase n=1 Tax=Capsicum baccatum TaxID=33114 RepID=A0A2G2W5Q8_CAPBA|nr:hypothetical protein CQW23_19410 [Capsicum baccatum]
MAAAFSSIRISASLTANYRQIGIPAAKGIMVNSHPRRTCIPAMAMGMTKSNRHDHDSSINNSREVADIPQERDFTGTPYIPIYVTLPLGIINSDCEIVDVDGLLNQLNTLKSTNIDGVTIECCSGDDVYIPLPQWVMEIGYNNPDIFFTDKEQRRNHECLTWGIDRERVLRGRTAHEVYFDLMRRFRMVFNEFFENGSISQIEIGLGPRGELRYPSHSAKFGWKYPGIVEFQCYDKYLFKSLQKEQRHGEPHPLVKDPKIQLPGIHWWRNTNSHAAELTAGFYYRCYSQVASMLKRRESTLNFACFELRTRDEEREFLKSLADPKIPVGEKEFLQASADPNKLVFEVLTAAWDVDIPAAGENARPIYHREGYNRILENAKPLGDPSCRCRLSVCL